MHGRASRQYRPTADERLLVQIREASLDAVVEVDGVVFLHLEREPLADRMMLLRPARQRIHR
jgi:hypothetical protein